MDKQLEKWFEKFCFDQNLSEAASDDLFEKLKELRGVDDLDGELAGSLRHITEYSRYSMEKEGHPNWVEFEDVIIKCEKTLAKYRAAID